VYCWVGGICGYPEKAIMNEFRGSPRYRWLSALVVCCSVAGLVATPVRAASRPAAAAPLVSTAAAQMLVTSQGMTLYMVTSDKKNESTCTGDCATAWPPLLLPPGTTARPKLPGIPGKFGVAHREDGSNQLTYDGAPLYTWVKDKKPGDVTGQGVGGLWWAAVVPNSSLTTATSSLIKTGPVQILVDGAGRTLYVYGPDTKNKSTCIADCAAFWPPAELAPDVTVSASISGVTGTFATATRDDGSNQLTYDGAPLYRFIKDKNPGDMLGQGVAGIWWILVVPGVRASSTLST
jgi:predicted lipoprotein with Yx(FWY)xxD motif